MAYADRCIVTTVMRVFTVMKNNFFIHRIFYKSSCSQGVCQANEFLVASLQAVGGDRRATQVYKTDECNFNAPTYAICIYSYANLSMYSNGSMPNVVRYTLLQRRLLG